MYWITFPSAATDEPVYIDLDEVTNIIPDPATAIKAPTLRVTFKNHDVMNIAPESKAKFYQLLRGYMTTRKVKKAKS